MWRLTDEVRQALREIVAQPLLTTGAVIALALGIGANTAVFSLVYALLVKPLPFPDAGRLVLVYNSYPKMGFDGGMSVPDYLERQTAPSLDSLALHQSAGLNLADSEETPERISALRATPSLFRVLAIQPLLGRFFSEDEAVPGNGHVVVLSYSLWQRRFGGDSGVVGRDIRLDGESYRVIGVMPAEFVYPTRRMEAIVPFAFTAAQRSNAGRGQESSRAIGRLRAGATIEGFERDMRAIAQVNSEPEFIGFREATGYKGRARFLRDAWAEDSRQALFLLQAVAALVLFVAAANVGNLTLARFSARRRELVVRLAVGARQSRIIVQMVVENVLMAFAGGIAGIVFAFVLIRLLQHTDLLPGYGLFAVGLDFNIMAFGVGISVGVGLLFSLVLAFAWRYGRAGTLKEAGRDIGGGLASDRLRSFLVVMQLALALILLVAGGLLISDFNAALREPAGFNGKNILTARIDLPANKYSDNSKLVAVQSQMLAAAKALPGVVDAALVSDIPFSAGYWAQSFTIDGWIYAKDQPAPRAQQLIVSPEYFQTLGIPLLSGRHFSESDHAGAARVALIDQTFARRHFPGRNPIGERIAPGDKPRKNSDWWTVIGVVASVRQGNNEATDTGTIYRSFAQLPLPSNYLALKTRVRAMTLAKSLRETIRLVDQDQPLSDMRTLQQRIRDSLSPRRFSLLLSLLFGGMALLLATIGVYAVMAFKVSQHCNEIGLRMALGASRSQALCWVLREGLHLGIAGILLGTLATLAATRFISSQLQGVSGGDPFNFCIAAVVLTLAVFLACLLPANRAAAMDPALALQRN